MSSAKLNDPPLKTFKIPLNLYPQLFPFDKLQKYLYSAKKINFTEFNRIRLFKLGLSRCLFFLNALWRL